MYVIKTMPKNKSIVVFIFSLLSLIIVQAANALSLGDIQASSTVGQKLNAVIEVDSRKPFDASQVLVSLAPRSVYDRLDVYWEYSHSSLNFEVSQIDSKNALLKVTSSEIIYEPYLEFVVSVRWPEGLLTKVYTLLLDMAPVKSGGGISAPIVVEESIPEPVVTLPANREPASTEPVLSERETSQNNLNVDAAEEAVVASPVSEDVNEVANVIDEQASEVQASDIEEVLANEPLVQPSPIAEEKPAVKTVAPPSRNQWQVKTQYGDTLWSIAKKIEVDSGVNVWRVMSALYENNPDAFAGSAHNLLSNSDLSVSRSQIESAGPLKLQPVTTTITQDVQPIVEEEPSRREKREEQTEASTKTVSETRESESSEEKLLSIVTESDEEGAAALQGEDTSAAQSPLTGESSPIIGEIDRDKILAQDAAIDESLGEARQRVDAIESRLDTLLKQYDELSAKTEELRQLEQSLNRRIAERTQQGLDIPPTTSELPAGSSESLQSDSNETSFFERFGWLILALAILLLIALVWLIYTRPDRMVPDDGALPASDRAAGDSLSDAPDATSVAKQKGDEDWDDTAFLNDKQFSDEELTEMVRLKGEKAYVESQNKNTLEPADYNVSDGAVELQVAMYIAYERYEEAEELINASLLKQPDNTPLKLQLLEIFAAKEDREQFDALAEKLRALDDQDVNATINSLGEF